MVAERSGLDFLCVSAAYLALGVDLLTWWKTLWGVFCAEAVLDLILRASWREGKGELGPSLLLAIQGTL